ncbi:MAG: VWA domain-containing protein [Lentisphaeria bacterium]|jgi:Ca-activated chloride channel family protein
MQFINGSISFWLASLAVLAAAALIAIWGARRRRQRLAQLVLPPLDAALTASLHPGRRRLRTALFFAGSACLILALARPWWGTRQIPTTGRSRDLLFVVDCSRSMLAADVAPSRLEHAKWIIRELAGRFPGDRFGLVAFAGDALLECPLTQDANTLFQFTQALDTRTIPVGGTSLERALTVATDAFRAAADRNRAIILLSDGEELAGRAAATAATLREREIPVLAIGLGDPARGSVVQLEDQTMLRDKDGDLVQTRLQEEGLRELARATGGLYVRSTTLAPNLAAVARRIHDLVPAAGESQMRERPIERYQLPLAAGILLLLLRLGLGERRPDPGGRRRRLPLLAAALLLPTTAATAANAGPPPAESQRLAAEIRRATATDRPRLKFNLGVLHQQQGAPEQAAPLYAEVLADPTAAPDLRAAALQNLGTLDHLAARRQATANPGEAQRLFQRAQAQYQEALRLHPFDPPLTQNLELAIHDLHAHQQREAARREQQARQEQLRQQVEQALRKQREATQAQGTGKEQPQQEAKAKTEAARDRLRGPPPPDTGQQAAQEHLGRAAQAQDKALAQPPDSPTRRAAEETAERELAQALQKLGGQPGKDGEKTHPRDNTGQPPPPAAGAPAGTPPPPSPNAADRPLPTQPQPDAAGQAAKDGQPPQPQDAAQAAAILEQMQKQEQDYRDALRQQMRRRQQRLAEPEKDW